ncbi:MAG: DUF5106 domain-containing protein [Bacteroidales bacterium]|nr:DUF5106 domain-containing protein [Bacteroidales bacterium]
MRKLSILVILIVLSFSGYSRGYKISLQIRGMENQEIILAHYMDKSIFPDDTLTLDDKGQGAFKGKESLPGGMYILYFPTGKYFEFLLGDDQDFSLVTDTLDFIQHAVIEGSEDNRIFFDFQRYMLSKRQELKVLTAELEHAKNTKEKEKAQKALKKISDERVAKIDDILNRHPDLFVSVFFRSTLDIRMPDPPGKKDGAIDSNWQYRYYKDHYFDNFNPHDGRLLRTPVYEDKIMQYLEKVVYQIPDTLIKEVDYLLDGSMQDSVLFRYLLVTLFNYYGNSKIMGLDAVQVHLAEEYYLKKAWWIDDDFREELVTRVAALKPLILGNPAPNIELLFVPKDHFPAAKNDSALKRYPHVGELMKINDIQAEYTVLIFWEASCSHCKKVVPNFYSIYKQELETLGVKVVSISTLFGEEGKVEWINFVNKYQLYDWMNAWNPYDYKYKIKYDVRATPQFFVLNRDKIIIGKRIGPEQVLELIKAYSAENSRIDN